MAGIFQKLRKFFEPALPLPEAAAAFFSICPIQRLSEPPIYLGAVAIAKNEGPYLEEWVEFHRLVGVDHFYIYDNESTDETSELLGKYQREGGVTVFPWPSIAGINGQHSAYAHATLCFRSHCRWLMFIDLDEFVFPATEDTLRRILKNYENYSLLELPWRCFGTAGHKTRPPGLVIENYTMRATIPSPVGTKMTKNLTKIKAICNPCNIKRLFVHGPEVEGLTCAPDDILLNHYYTRSEEEFESKLQRGYKYKGDVMTDKRLRRYRHLKNTLDNFSCEDVKITRFTTRLKEKLPPWA